MSSPLVQPIPPFRAQDRLVDKEGFLSTVWRAWLQALVTRLNNGIQVLTIQAMNVVPETAAPIIYVKDGTPAILVVAYDLAGTTRYKTLLLDGVDVTLTDTAVAP